MEFMENGLLLFVYRGEVLKDSKDSKVIQVKLEHLLVEFLKDRILNLIFLLEVLIMILFQKVGLMEFPRVRKLYGVLLVLFMVTD